MVLDNRTATEIALEEIRHVDFESIIVPFSYENTDGEALIIDSEGVTNHKFTYSILSMMPDDDGFDEMWSEAICVLRDNIGLLAEWLLNKNSICSL